MCLISFAWNAHPRYWLALAANRDEFHGRPSAPLGYWADAPRVAGGRDLREGGGWLALSAAGRLAAVTNVREPYGAAAPRSRGALVRDFVTGDAAALEQAARISAAGDAYGPHNLLLWDGAQLLFLSNRNQARPRTVEPGLHGISNGPYDAPWPKTLRLNHHLGAWLDAQRGTPEEDIEPLLQALADEQGAADAELPQTGVGLDLERVLAPPFIRGLRYGTRASTVLLLRRDGSALLFERSYGPDKQALGDVRLELRLDTPPAS